MENPGCLKILFIINPVSGRKKNCDWESIIRDYFKDHSHTIDFYLLSGKDDTGSVINRAEKLQSTRIVAVGGDGTVNMIAKQLVGTNLIMGIIPGGSANGMARELEIPESPEEALNIIVYGKVKNCDVIKINENDISLHLSDFGLNARLIKYFDEGTLRGMWGYSRMVAKVLWRKKLMNAHIVSESLDFNTTAYMIVIANATRYGTGAFINPGGDVSDGIFEIVVLRQVSLLQLFRMFLSYKNFDPKKVEIYRAKKATISTVRRTHFQIDGEYKGRIDRVEATILPSQLKLLVKDMSPVENVEKID